MLRYSRRLPAISTSLKLFAKSNSKAASRFNSSSSSSLSSTSNHKDINKKPNTPHTRSQYTPTKPENLAEILKNVIQATGPITIASYMRQCLTDPDYGYYTTRNPLDLKQGDFVTSPEISSTFGEVCALWYFSCFLSQLKKQATENPGDFKIQEKTFRFIEFGPGKGTLMFDILATLTRFIKNNNPMEVIMIEKSDVLINEQYKLLCDPLKSELIKIDEGNYKSVTKWGNEIKWTKDDHIPMKVGKEYMNFIMAHELFDALPIHQFTKTEKGWREFLVDLKTNVAPDILLPNVSHETAELLSKNKETEFKIIQAPFQTLSSALPKTIPRFDRLPVGSKIEICPDSHNFISQMSQILKTSDIGAGLIIDYGTETIPINTLRGIKDHKFVNPLAQPGEVDLSIDVDFTNLAQLLSQDGFLTYIADQGDFLNSMGLGYRTDQLVAFNEGNEEKKQKIIDAYKRLTNKGIRDMGKIYKVLGFYDSRFQDIQPPGFAEIERLKDQESQKKSAKSESSKPEEETKSTNE